MRKKRRTPAHVLPPGVEMDLVASIDRAPVWHDLDDQIDRLMSLLDLGGRHPVMVGPSEVGKSAIAWGVAKRIASGARPGGARALWQISLRSIDGVPGKDDPPGVRLGKILRDASESPLRPIVFIRDLRLLRSMEAQHSLLEALQHSEARMLGEATPSFHAWVADDPELAGLVHVVRVEEPEPERVRRILSLHARGLERTFGLAIDAAAVERVIHHADQLLPTRRHPGKSLGLLDDAARETKARGEHKLSAARVTERMCDSLRIPRWIIDPDAAFEVDALVSHLQSRVVGQDDAIDGVAQSLAIYKAGLSDPHRPMGVVLLTGPPGVGKTLLAQSVAEYVFGSRARLVRISLAEHSEDWKVDQLFGQRSSQSLDARRGVLARQLGGKPFAVLLLDEVDKAHALAFKHLLRPLDDGMFVNGNDEEISLRNTLVIITSDVGAEVYRESAVGFSNARDSRAQRDQVLRRVVEQFPAGLLDRVDRICVCPPLDEPSLRELAQREIHAALRRTGINPRLALMAVDDAVIDRVVAEVAATATSRSSGARELRRAIGKLVLNPIAKRLAVIPFGEAHSVRVAMRDGTVSVELTRLADRSLEASHVGPTRGGAGTTPIPASAGVRAAARSQAASGRRRRSSDERSR